MIDYPLLVIEDEDRLAANAIARVSGGLTADRVNAQIAERQQILNLIEAGLDAPICPELTNANPSAPHTVLLEAFAWTLAQLAYRLNRVPEQNFIAFANLFNIEPRAATASETVLRFTVAAPTGTDVTIPIGTQVSDADGIYIFETIEQIVISSGTTVGSATARRTISGHTLLAPNVLTERIDNVAFVESVTNLSAIDSGTELESLESTLSRVRIYQRRGEHIVSTKDLEDAILNEALNGNGIVRAFPFIRNADFQGEIKPGYTTVIVMTKTGDSVDANALSAISALLDEAVGNQFIYISNPEFVEFDIAFNVRLSGSLSSAVVAAIENNLRNFYAPSSGNFGRAIYRSEIIAVVEGTAGVDRIESVSAAQILANPSLDVHLAVYQLPKLVNVTINII